MAWNTTTWPQTGNSAENEMTASLENNLATKLSCQQLETNCFQVTHASEQEQLCKKQVIRITVRRIKFSGYN